MTWRLTHGSLPFDNPNHHRGGAAKFLISAPPRGGTLRQSKPQPMFGVAFNIFDNKSRFHELLYIAYFLED